MHHLTYNSMIDWLIEWMYGWMIAWIDGWTDWLIDCLIGWMSGWVDDVWLIDSSLKFILDRMGEVHTYTIYEWSLDQHFTSIRGDTQRDQHTDLLEPHKRLTGTNTSSQSEGPPKGSTQEPTGSHIKCESLEQINIGCICGNNGPSPTAPVSSHLFNIP